MIEAGGTHLSLQALALSLVSSSLFEGSSGRLFLQLLVCILYRILRLAFNISRLFRHRPFGSLGDRNTDVAFTAFDTEF